MRLAIAATHPIQYQAPWFRALTAERGVDLQVLFGHRATAQDQAAAGFGVAFEWDTQLLDGYEHQFLRNVAAKPSASGFFDIDTPSIGDELARGRFDAVIVQGWHSKSYCQAIAACWRQGIPVMVRGDSHLRREANETDRRRLAVPEWLRGLQRLAYRTMMPKFDACLAAGAWSREYFERMGAPPDRVVLVPHMVSPAFAESLPQWEARRTELRDHWGLRPDATVFLFAGKLVSSKRPLDFLEAIRRAAPEANIAGLIAGEGPERRTCEDYVRRHALPVRFAGFLNQSRIGPAYAASDALVLPSRETWGLVVNEAMACARPAIVSDLAGCHPDLIVPGQTGVVYPHRDVMRLAAALRENASPAALRAMGARAQQHSARVAQRQAVLGTLEAMSLVCRRRPLEVSA